MWRVWGKGGITSREMREGAEPGKESPGGLISPCRRSPALHGPTVKCACEGKRHTGHHRHNGPRLLHQDYSHLMNGHIHEHNCPSVVHGTVHGEARLGMSSSAGNWEIITAANEEYV